MPTLTDIQRTLRDHVRFTGDGLPGEPVGAPLPVGSPRSGEHNPSKKELRDILIAVFSESGAGASGIAQEALETANAASSTASSINALASRADQSAGPGIGQYASLAAAVADNIGGTIRINYDETNLPADFAGVMLEYTQRTTTRNFNQSGFLPDQALRTFRTQHPANHPDVKWSGLNVEVQARGSGKNGPFSADYGFTLNVAKRGYSSGSALSGEMDGLTIYLRQDGPDGFPSQDPGSSDAAAIMVNAQNIGTCGFVALSDQTVSNLRREAGFPVDLQMQTQHGVIDANNAAGKVAFGWVASMKTGIGRTAFHAAALEGAGWENLFDSPNLRATWAGELRFRSTADYSDYGGRVLRPVGLNSQLSIENRGTLGVAIRALDAAPVTLASGGSNRWQLSAAGNWQPVTDLAGELGNAARRIGNTHTNALVVYGNSLTAAGLPSYADNAAALAGGLTAGRFYRRTGHGLDVVI